MSLAPLPFYSTGPAIRRTDRLRRAFSLLELLVILAFLTFCSLLLTTALARTAPNTKGFRCLNNLRQFMQVWTMYAEDHSDRVANNYILSAPLNTVSDRTNRTWANNVMSWDTQPGNTNVLLLKAGLLGPYLNDDVRVFRCPADNYLSPVQLRLGWTARVRSISMNAVFGLFVPDNNSGTQLFGYEQFLKLAIVPKPSLTWVVLDEHPDSIDDGVFLSAPDAHRWGDIPASYHAGGCGFAFADGHSELRKWLSSTSRFPVRFYYPSAPPLDAAGKLDFQWFLERTGFVDPITGRPAYGY